MERDGNYFWGAEIKNQRDKRKGGGEKERDKMEKRM